MQNLKLLIVALFLSASAIAQIPSGYTPIQGKKYFKDATGFSQPIEFPSSVTLSGTDVSHFKAGYLWGNHAGRYWAYTDTSTYLMNRARALSTFQVKGSYLDDNDFTSNGILKRTASGTYTSITDNSTQWNTDHTLLLDTISFSSLATQNYVTINDATDNYTLALVDAANMVTMSNVSAKTITVPLYSSVAFPLGTQIQITNYGPGQLSIAGASGVTIQSLDGLNIKGVYGKVQLTKTGTDRWLMAGDVSSSLYNGLVGYWKLDESSGILNDWNGNNPGSYAGATIGSTGKLGLCASFDGTNDSINLGKPSNLDLRTAISISLWLYPTNVVKTWQPVVSKLLIGPTGERNGYALWLNGNVLTFETANATTSADCGALGTVTANSWLHLVLTWDGSSVLSYLNGTYYTTKSLTVAPVSNVYNLLLGFAAQAGSTDGYEGKIDEVKIWNRTVTALEVTEDYNGGTGKTYRK